MSKKKFTCVLKIYVELPIEAESKEQAEEIYYKLKQGRDAEAISEILKDASRSLDEGTVELAEIVEETRCAK